MKKTDKIWMDGNLIDWGDANTHILSHSLHYGSSVFEGIRCYKTSQGSAVFRLKDHIDRLFNSAGVLGMEIPFSKDEIAEATKQTIRVNNMVECYIRPIIFFADGTMGLDPRGAPVRVAIAVWPWKTYLGDQPVRIKTSSYRRISPESTVITAKIGGHYVNSILASLEAKMNNYDEALLLDQDGNIAEGPGENIFIVKEDLKTPPLGKIFPGITRDSIIQLARNEGYTVKEEVFGLAEAKACYESFFTGTAAEITPIGQIDDIEMPHAPGKTTKKLQGLFYAVLRGEHVNSRYETWLDYV